MTAVAADNMTECARAWGALLFGTMNVHVALNHSEKA